jgi:hypothetical protein
MNEVTTSPCDPPEHLETKEDMAAGLEASYLKTAILI